MTFEPRTMEPANSLARPLHMPMLIGGAEVASADRIVVSNPANPAEIVGTVGRGTPAEVRSAILAAKAAQVAWGALSFTQRAAILLPAVERVGDAIDARAILFVRENGKPLAEARGELAGVPARQKLTLALAPSLDEGRHLESPGGSAAVAYKPYGVVVSIVPWNAPISLAFGQVIPALLAGNGVVVKPPETAPLALTASLRLLADALPSGLINIVTGLPGEIGDALVTDPDVGKIGFTGGITAARQIMAKSAGSIKSLTLELGGNDAAIVLDDARLSVPMMERMVRSVFRMSGQVCMAIKRIYVPGDMQPRFVEAFCEVADRLVVGDGLIPGVTMGPMHTAQALARAKGLVAAAYREGAQVRELGRRDPRAEDVGGYFMQPTVVCDVRDDSALMAEEQFCPAVPIATYSDINDAVERANNSIFGLGASVWGEDVDRAALIARRLQAGTVFVNAHGTEAIDRRAPYGGMKQSGLGRKAGVEGVLEYADIQTLTTFLG